MSNIVIRKKRGTTFQLSSLTAHAGELYIDITKPTVVIHDGSTVGGIPLAHEVHSHATATSGSFGTAGFMSSSDKAKLDALSLSGGIQNVLSNTVPLPPQTTANFSTDFTVNDNSIANRTEFAISQTFRDELNNDAVSYIIALT